MTDQDHACDLVGEAVLAPSLMDLDRLGQERFLRAIEGATAVRRRHQLYLWSQGELQGVLPHSLLICVLREPHSGSLAADRFSTVPVPDRAFEQICAPGDGLLARLTSAWVEGGGRPILIAPEEARFAQARTIAAARGGGLAMHGTFDASGAPGSGFLFFDIDLQARARCALLLELLVPYLHAALVRVSINPHDESMLACRDGGLTAREIQILHFVQQGMSNTDIGDALGISPLTVKNHVQKVLRKLGVGNRAQAVVKATLLRLLTPLPRGGDDRSA